MFKKDSNLRESKETEKEEVMDQLLVHISHHLKSDEINSSCKAVED